MVPIGFDNSAVLKARFQARELSERLLIAYYQDGVSDYGCANRLEEAAVAWAALKEQMAVLEAKAAEAPKSEAA